MCFGNVRGQRSRRAGDRKHSCALCSAWPGLLLGGPKPAPPTSNAEAHAPSPMSTVLPRLLPHSPAFQQPTKRAAGAHGAHSESFSHHRPGPGPAHALTYAPIQHMCSLSCAHSPTR